MDWNFTLIKTLRDFLGGPGAKTQAPNAWGVGLILGWGTKIPHATRCSKKKKKNILKNQVTPSLKRQSEMLYIKSPNTGQNSLKLLDVIKS